MDLYDILLLDIHNTGEAANRALDQGLSETFALLAVTYHKLAEMYLALTGIEVRPNA